LRDIKEADGTGNPRHQSAQALHRRWLPEGLCAGSGRVCARVFLRRFRAAQRERSERTGVGCQADRTPGAWRLASEAQSADRVR